MTQWGIVPVDHHQFTLAAQDVDTLGASVETSLMDIGKEFATIHTGIAHGPVRVGIDLPPEAPLTDVFPEWEIVTEVDIEVTKGFSLLTIDGKVVPGFDLLDSLSEGRHRLRAHARGRDAYWDMEVAESYEDYLLQLWPSNSKRVVRQVKKTDSAWTVAESADHVAPDLDPAEDASRSLGRLTALGSGGDRRFGAQVRYSTNPDDWGGRLPDGRLLDIPDRQTLDCVMWIARLDRPLVDALAVTGPPRSEFIGRWLARRAYEEAELTSIEWAVAGLDAMDADESLPPEFHDPNILGRLRADPRFPKRKVVDPRSDFVGEYENWPGAFSTVGLATTSKPFAIFQILWNAIATFGRDGYRQLLEQLKSQFYPHLL